MLRPGFDVPGDYVHRIGRTARAEAEGDAWVLVAPAEEKSLARIERHIGQRLPRVTLPDFDSAQTVPTGGGRGGRHGGQRPHGAGHAPRGDRPAAPPRGGEKTDGTGRAPHGGRKRRRRR